MDNSRKIHNTFHVLILCFFLTSYSVNSQITDNQKLIYAHCPNQTSPNPSHLPLLSNLFEQFTAKSSQSSFFQTIVADEKTAISGAFQCRNSLSPDECRTCVSKLPSLSKDLCGRNLPARIQLSGCYAHYQEEEEDQPEARPEQVLHRACSKRRIERRGFEEVKCEAFAALERCVVSENGYCEMTYESVRVLGQCGGDLGHCDCGECLNNAVQIAGEDGECRYSVSGEIYLESCFISYDYDRDHEFGTFKEGGGRSPKTVAIVVGGLAVIFLGIGLCYCMMSLGRKKDDW